MKKQSRRQGPRTFDEVLDLIEEANARQKQFICEGDSVERRATEFYCAKLRLTRRILLACGKVVEGWWTLPGSHNGKECIFSGETELMRSISAYQKFMARWERAERRRVAFEIGEGFIAQGLKYIPALNAGTKIIRATKMEARKLGLRIKP
jgi:hypothetical protein